MVKYVENLRKLSAIAVDLALALIIKGLLKWNLQKGFCTNIYQIKNMLIFTKVNIFIIKIH